MITWLEGVFGITTTVTTVFSYLCWRNACVERGLRANAERALAKAEDRVDRLEIAMKMDRAAKGEYNVKESEYYALEDKYNNLYNKAKSLHEQALRFRKERDALRAESSILEDRINRLKERANSPYTKVDETVIKSALRKYMACMHPDQKGGSTEKFQQVQNVYDKFK